MGLENSIVCDGKIDPAFVLPPEHRPQQRPYNDSVPVIDLSPLRPCPGGDTDSRIRLIGEVGEACEQWGFFQVINHGVPIGLLEKVKEEAGAFFALPFEEKRKVRRTAQNPMGYYDAELTKNVRDWKEVFDISATARMEPPMESEADSNEIAAAANQWPRHPPELREACEAYIAPTEKLAFSLLELISESLGLPSIRFHHLFKPGTTFLRLNHYPVCPAPTLALGVSRHKDPGALTVLAQDHVGGLEVRRKDGAWIGVKPDMAALVINVGDLMQVWSNGRYRSVEHRVVVNESRDRFSTPLFFSPSRCVQVFPIPELLAGDGDGDGEQRAPPGYAAFEWGEFLKSRTDSNFRDLGKENLQISDFALSG